MSEPIPSPDSPQDLAAKVLTKMVQQKAERLIESATLAIGAGVGTYSLIAGRPAEGSEWGAIVLVVSGRMTDGDMRRFMEFAAGFEQDVSMGSTERTVSRMEVNLKPEEPA